jgi:hypothetical protein
VLKDRGTNAIVIRSIGSVFDICERATVARVCRGCISLLVLFRPSEMESLSSLSTLPDASLKGDQSMRLVRRADEHYRPEADAVARISVAAEDGRTHFSPAARNGR